FQGSEAEVVVVSLGLVDGDTPARQRFAAEPNLFNVMTTRARRRLVLVTSLSAGHSSPGGGLIADFLVHASAPRPLPAREDASTVPWVRRLAAELSSAGRDVRVSYPVGEWTVDLVVAGVGLFCAPHP